MKKIIPILFAASLLFPACTAMANLDKRAQSLELGMSRRQAVNVMNKDFNVELKSRTPEGDVEVLRFFSSLTNDYILHFVNGELVEFHKYVEPPQAPPHNHNH